MNAKTKSLLALASYAVIAILCGLGFHFEHIILSGDLPYFLLGPLLLLPTGPVSHFFPQLALNVLASVLANGIAAALLLAVIRFSHRVVRMVCFAILAIYWNAVGFICWLFSA